jgi:dipeptidyl aminopeptidase/acylaminoacyl peptidase
MMKGLAAAAAVSLLLSAAVSAQTQAPTPAPAAAPADPAISFGARESIENISLSPGGTKVAFVAPGKGQGNVLYTVDVAGDAVPQKTLTASGDPERITSCNWVSERRLVCSVYSLVQDAGELIPYTRVVAVNAGGGDLKLLSRTQRADDVDVALGGGEVIDWLPSEDGAVLMGRQYVPQERLGTHVLDKREGFGVDRIDTLTLASKAVEPAKPLATEYISDGHGTVRIMGLRGVNASDQDTGITQYYYRAKGSRDWKKLGDYNYVTAEGFNPYAVDPDLDVAYGYRKKEGRQALYALALDGSGRETLVYARPDVDLSGLVRIGRNGRVVGVTYATEKRQAVYFDKSLEALAQSLGKALPGLPLIYFVDSSVDESKLLIWAGSDTDPGRYFLFDKGTKQLGELMLARPELEGVRLATVKPVVYRAADGAQVPGYLTLPPGRDPKNLPAIVMPHGGPGYRDEWGFDWLAQYFANRGFAVLQPNFRGSAGYGDGWFQKNGFQSWRSAIGDVNDAGRWLVSQGIADPSKLAIFGWSYGGYAALQANVLDPDLFKAAVAVAPVTDLAAVVVERKGWSDERITAQMVGSGPHVREGSPANHADMFKAPVLIFHGEFDRNVGVQQSRTMVSRLKGAGKSAELVTYPKLDHNLEDSPTRADMLRRADAFLRTALKLP